MEVVTIHTNIDVKLFLSIMTLRLLGQFLNKASNNNLLVFFAFFWRSTDPNLCTHPLNGKGQPGHFAK